MKVLVLVCKGTELIELSAFVDVFGWDRTDNDGAIEVVTCGFSKTVTCSFGFRVEVDVLVDDVAVDDYAALCIPGGFEDHGYYEEAFSDTAGELVRAFHQKGKPIASICVGALTLARSGILEGRKATTYHLAGSNRMRQLADLGARAVEEHVVVDGNIITSAGPSSAMDVAFELLSILRTRRDAARVRELMGF